MNVYEKPHYLISLFFLKQMRGMDSNPGTPAGDTWLSRTLVLQEFIFAFCWRIMSLGYYPQVNDKKGIFCVQSYFAYMKL